MKLPGVHTLIVILAVWLFCGSALRFYRARKRKVAPIETGARIRAAFPMALNYVAAVFVAGAIAWASVHFVRRTPALLMIAAILASSTIDLVVAFRYPDVSRIKAHRLIGPGISVLCSLVIFSYVVFVFTTPRSDVVRLVYPAKGTWQVAAGGRTKLTNYHHGNPPAQNYAVDMIYCDGNSEGQDIYAPVDGVVVRVENGLADAPEGNLVVIGCAGEVEIWLAHLQQDSIVVRKGERVVRGQRIAACGSTGSAVSAHLHIHAQRGGEPVAMVFGENGRFLVKNDRFASN